MINTDRKRKITLFAAAILCYANAYSGTFVFDDSEAIINNPVVSGNAQDGFWTGLLSYDFWGHPILSYSSHKSWRPLTTFTFRLNYLLFGLNTTWYHLVNILLHGYVVLLLYDVLLKVFSQILRKRYQNIEIAYCSSLIFAVHPIHVESVTSIVGRAELLNACFSMLSIDEFLHQNISFYDAKRCNSSLRISLNYVIFTTLALLSKEQGIMGPIICIWLYVCILPKGNNDPGINKSSWSGFVFKIKQLRQIVVKSFPLLLVFILLALARLWIVGFKSPNFSVADNPASFHSSVLSRILSYNHLFALNLWLLINPSSLCFDYSMGCIPVITTLWDIRIMTVLVLWSSAFVIILRIHDSYLDHAACAKIGLIFLIVPFLPASNLIVRVGFVLAERVLYMPSIGYSTLISTAYCGIRWKLLADNKHKIVLLNVAFSFVILLFIFKCWHRNGDWFDEKTLFLAGAKICPKNAKVHYNIGRILNDIGNSKDAESAYREALRLNPRYDHAMNNLANILKEKGDFVEAEGLLERAVSLRPNFATAWMNLGIVKANGRKYKESEACYFKALDYRTNYADCYFNMGNLYLEMGKEYQAVNCWINATKLNPRHAKSWINLMLLLDERNEAQRSLHYGSLALKNLGEEPTIYSIMAGCLGKLSRFQESESFFFKALKNQPSNANHYGNLGVLYHRWKRYDRAHWAYSKALDIEPGLNFVKKHLSDIFKMV